MISPRQFLTVTMLCGAAALIGSSNSKLSFEPFTTHDIATPASDLSAAPRETSSNTGATTTLNSSSAEVMPPDELQETITGSLGKTEPSADSLVSGTMIVAPPVSDSLPTSPPRLVSAFPSRAMGDDPLPAVPPLEMNTECLVAETCVDEYLWALYERAPKVDTNKVTERIKKAIKKDGKIRNIIRTITNYVVGDFTWKDPDAAQKAGMSLKDYVIGGMDPKFKLTLARALRMMDDAGFQPAITSAFRDDYRQSIANGNKAASDSSFHGGSRRGGYGHGLAADLVSVKGENRKERLASSDALWKWIDANEKELGIGRPYRDRDPPHVGPLDGKEYIVKRAAAETKKAAAKAKTSKAATAEAKKPAQPARPVSGTTKRASAPSSKVSSLQTTLAADR